MSVDRATLVGGPAKLTFDGATLFAKDDFKVDFIQEWKEVPTSMHGVVDKAVVDQRIEIKARLWGAWENLSALFPSDFMAVVPGTRLYSTTDKALVVAAKNTDLLTVHNVRMTKMANLFLGVADSVFAADVEFTGLIKNNANPEDAASYYTLTTGAYTDTTLAKTNYKQQRYGAAWGAVAGFTDFQGKGGWQVEWDAKLEPEKVDGAGTVDMVITDFVARARAIPLGPTLAQYEAAFKFQGTGNALGKLLSAQKGDLALTGTGVSVTLKEAAMLSGKSMMFGIKPLRIGETTWETTVGIAAGVATRGVTIA